MKRNKTKLSLENTKDTKPGRTMHCVSLAPTARDNPLGEEEVYKGMSTSP